MGSLRRATFVFSLITTIGWTTEAWSRNDGTTYGVGIDTARSLPSNQRVRAQFAGDSQNCVRLAAAGIITRNSDPTTNTTGGIIQLSGPNRNNTVWAGLYWVVLDDEVPTHANHVVLNGVEVTPEALPVTDSPCWAEKKAYAYFADVTSLVQGGPNYLSGIDDSGQTNVAPESEGASLLVVYNDRSSSACEIVITDGNDLLKFGGAGRDNALPVACGSSIPSRLWVVAADGQDAPDHQLWNGMPLGSDDNLDASDPKSTAQAKKGWDTDHFDVMTGGTNTASVRLPVLGSSDCVNWIATAIEVGVYECRTVSIEPQTWGQIKGSYR
jgi:hypothetical protein